MPRIDSVLADTMPDGRLLLQIKDAPFSSPVLAKFTSDGTLKMLAYLVLIYDPAPPPFIGIEEPENYLHPRLLPELAEECRAACERTQLLVTTHSPFFLNALRPEEVRVLWRDESGFTQTRRVADLRKAWANSWMRVLNSVPSGWKDTSASAIRWWTTAHPLGPPP